MCGLNCKVVANIRKDKTFMAENVFDIDSAGYRTKVSDFQHVR